MKLGKLVEMIYRDPLMVNPADTAVVGPNAAVLTMKQSTDEYRGNPVGVRN